MPRTTKELEAARALQRLAVVDLYTATETQLGGFALHNQAGQFVATVCLIGANDPTVRRNVTERLVNVWNASRHVFNPQHLDGLLVLCSTMLDRLDHAEKNDERDETGRFVVVDALRITEELRRLRLYFGELSGLGHDCYPAVHHCPICHPNGVKVCVKCRAMISQPVLERGEPERCERCADVS